MNDTKRLGASAWRENGRIDVERRLNHADLRKEGESQRSGTSLSGRKKLCFSGEAD